MGRVESRPSQLVQDYVDEVTDDELLVYSGQAMRRSKGFELPTARRQKDVRGENAIEAVRQVYSLNDEGTRLDVKGGG